MSPTRELLCVPRVSQSMPSQPALNTLVDHESNLTLPKSVGQTWQSHNMLRPTFTAWLDTFLERYKVADAASEEEQSSKSKLTRLSSSFCSGLHTAHSSHS